MAHWNRADLEAAGILKPKGFKADVKYAYCQRCGKRHPEMEMKEIGYEVFICEQCLGRKQQ